MYEGMLKWALLLLFHANASFAKTHTFLNIYLLYAKIKHETWQWQPIFCIANYYLFMK